MIILSPTRLHWLNGKVDSPYDICAHSPVHFAIDDTLLVSPEEEEDWTVSAAALYLLRTLSRDHTPEHPVGEHLFPHCGHSLWVVEGQEDVVITGCNLGRDFSVRHVGPEVHIQSPGEPLFLLPAAQWREAVHTFSDTVQAFYERGSPKQFSNAYEADGFVAFQREWKRRRSQS